MRKDRTFAMIIVLLLLAMALLATTVRNEGCLPWQERIGENGGSVGPGREGSRCSGSWLPFG